MSEPESRAIVEFASRHPEIFAWVDFHTYGGVGIRPLGHAPDHQMAPSDLALYRQIEHWLQQMTGYPMVSGYHEFLYEPEKPLHGDLSDYAYHQRGAVAYVVELWDLFQRLGKERPPRFVDHYFRLEREDLVKLARWDQEHNDGRLIGPWREVHHPQLGPVEIGGIDPRVGVWNPSLPELGEVCQRHARCFLQLAALAPSLAASAEVVALGEDLYRVRLEVQNLGYLPTSVLASAERLDFNEPVHVDCEARGCALVDPGRARVVLRHLDGWGVGRHGGINAPSHQRSRTGSGSRARVDYLVRGRGTLVLRVGACRVGWQEREVVVE